MSTTNDTATPNQRDGYDPLEQFYRNNPHMRPVSASDTLPCEERVRLCFVECDQCKRVRALRKAAL